MYDPNASYEDNYARGPQADFLPGGVFPLVHFGGRPKYSFLGQPLFLPFGVPAGPLLNARYVEVALKAGFCLPTYKTVRGLAWPSHPWPNVLGLEAQTASLFQTQENTVVAHPLIPEDFQNPRLSISNSFGVPSRAPTQWIADVLSLVPVLSTRQSGAGVVLSFQGSLMPGEGFEGFIKDSVMTARLAAQAASLMGGTCLEVNLSCPNEDKEPLYKDVARSLQLLKALHAELEGFANIKLIAKLGVLNVEQTKRLLGEGAFYLQGVSAINTVSATILDRQGAFALGANRSQGGVCGALIYEQGIRMVSQLAEVREDLGLLPKDFGIIGVGGVLCAQDVLGYLSAGADVVQVATGMMWNLDLACQVADALRVSYTCAEEKGHGNNA